MTGLLILEEVYNMALNPNLPYGAQLEVLAASGELSNKLQTNTVLFKLCELVDLQGKRIKALEEDRMAIAKRIVELQNGIADKKNGHANIVKNDPTQPLV